MKYRDLERLLIKSLSLVEHHTGDGQGDECGILSREIFADLQQVAPDFYEKWRREQYDKKDK